VPIFAREIPALAEICPSEIDPKVGPLTVLPINTWAEVPVCAWTVPLPFVVNTALVPKVVVPVPPFATGKTPATSVARLMLPPLAAVRRPWASTVRFARTYAPGATVVFASPMVPAPVIVPPERPVPAVIEVTVPPAAPLGSAQIHAPPLTFNILPSIPQLVSALDNFPRPIAPPLISIPKILPSAT
jgi:hypothetical protein